MSQVNAIVIVRLLSGNKNENNDTNMSWLRTATFTKKEKKKKT